MEKKLYLLLVTIIICLLAAEWFVRVLDSTILVYDIEMAKSAALLKTDSKSPDRCHEYRKNSHARLMGVDVTINSLGLRDKEYSIIKPPGTYRILVLGDSLTLGWGVEQKDCYSKRLEGFLNERLSPKTNLTYEVINSGVDNYNTVQEWAYFKEDGYKLDPDMILVGFYINDAEPVPVRRRNFIWNYSHLAVFFWSRVNTLFSGFSPKANYKEYYLNLYRDDNPGWIRCRQALSYLSEYGKSHGKKVVIAFLPELHDLSNNYPFKEINRKMLNFMQGQKGVYYFDLYDNLKGTEARSLWVSYDDAHPNRKAHNLIAEALYDNLLKEKLLQ